MSVGIWVFFSLGLLRIILGVPEAMSEMPVAIGPYGQSQLSCFNRTKVDFVMGCTMGMVAGTFSCLGIGVHGQELIGSTRKTMIQSGSTFGTFMPIKVGS